MTLPDKLIELRRARGLSQEQLADLLGVSRQAVSKWESGQSTPDLARLVALADYFSVSLDLLVRGDAPTAPPSAATPPPCPAACPLAVGGYEYTSRRRLLGLPLVHINYGPGRRVAKGIIAVGNSAVGVLALGGLSVGAVSLGGMSLGLLALGGWAVGGVALGGLAVGVLSLGGCAIGAVCALGGAAIAPVAVGDAAIGQAALALEPSVNAAAVRAFLQQNLPALPRTILSIVSFGLL